MTATLKLLRAERHISVSSISSYLKCPRQYEHRYVLGTPSEHRDASLAFGSSIHAALAVFYSALRDGKPEPTVEELSDRFRSTWQQELCSDPPILFGDKESSDSLAETGTSMLSCFLQSASRPCTVVEVEMPFSIELVDDRSGMVLPPLVGVFDAVVQDEDGSYTVLEHKTAARRWTSDRLSFDPQITGYHVAAPQMGLGNAQVAIQLLVKTKTPSFEVYTPARTDADRRDFLDTAIGVLRAVQAGSFYPRRDWFCRSCPYASGCLAG
jgi:putative RecB family exonuclease